MKNKKELIVITGGAGGIGTACAKTFKNEHLVITDYGVLCYSYNLSPC